MIITEREFNSCKDSSGFSDNKYTKTETIVRFLEDAINDVERGSNSTEIDDENNRNYVIINCSLNQISQKFTLNERQDITVKLQKAIL